MSDRSSSLLVRLWNRLPDVVSVKKFVDRPTALKRIWAAVQILESVPPKSETTSEGGPGTGCSGTKKAMLLELLNRPEGASVCEMMAALGWQSHSVRGFLSTLSKKDTAIHSFRRADGDRAYAIKAATAVQAEGVQ